MRTNPSALILLMALAGCATKTLPASDAERRNYAAPYYKFEAYCEGGVTGHHVGFYMTMVAAEDACKKHLKQSGHEGPCGAVGSNDDPD